MKNKSNLGEDCLFGGKNVLQAIQDKSFERNGSVSTKLTETIEQSNAAIKEPGTPSTFMEKVYSFTRVFQRNSVRNV